LGGFQRFAVRLQQKGGVSSVIEMIEEWLGSEIGVAGMEMVRICAAK
jgi:hypothetical protein